MGRLDTITDAEALAASVANPDEFDVVFSRHFPAIHRYLHRRIGADLADELAAQTFVTAFARRASFDGRNAEAGPWLYGIAGNLLRNHRRTERRQLQAYARTGIDPVAPDDFGRVEERLDAAVDARRVAAALASIRDEERDALLLVAWTSCTYEAAAEALGIPVGTVRSRISRARARLRELLAVPEQVGDTDNGGGER